ncbi:MULTISPECIES: DUF6381 family protein [Streptomyces]|uniref:DUF6381 family protein n=1 Tax=Streptomyces katrae TaxID=68223 RepID=A0ABT7GU86_9ACTN|nr:MULTISPECIES: DUF6381 family protein [Streptomyces]EFL12906.1 predicted protein [Streptomyces sp. C]MDK9497183.1 DUF6381 family protein [Streptomyces katrae]RST04295.1 hypothetical protein EF910_17220 [Streptomyces sp. WAC07149]GLX23281.1 hypothetical protein Slala01_69250 [Streptomyces lavendulae subsp. lavendulae]GLX30744.1 hypothetical protein Slala02_65640 [Streptomyces lavendulae subsp. lavendulae]
MATENRRTDEQARRMREQAEALELAANKSADAAEREGLMDEALRIRKDLEERHGPESATMDPM